MSRWPIVIPSMGRPDRVTALDLVPSGVVCIPEAELPMYREHRPDAEFVTHPDSLIGLPAKRQWIFDRWGTHFTMDDDIIAVVDATTAKQRKLDSDEVEDRIQRILDETIDLGLFLCAFSSEKNPIRFQPMTPYRLTGEVTAGGWGMVKGARFWFNPQMRLLDDFWISALNAHYHRMVLVDQRVFVHDPTMLKNPGGLAQHRTYDRDAIDNRILRATFGDANVGAPSSGSTGRSPYLRRLRLPF